MSESSADKTSRKFAAYLRRPIWKFQYSVFYVTPEDSHNLLKDQKVFRQELGRKIPNQPFLIRIQTLKPRWDDSVLQAYLTIYTTERVDSLKNLADDYFGADVRVIKQALSVLQCRNKARKIIAQRPHDLTKVFGQARVRRYGVINKHLLAELESSEEAAEN